MKSWSRTGNIGRINKKNRNIRNQPGDGNTTILVEMATILKRNSNNNITSYLEKVCYA